MKRAVVLAVGFSLGCGGGQTPPAAEPEPAGGGSDVQVAAESGTHRGKLEPSAIQRVVRSMKGDFQACYEKGLAEDPALAGRETMSFVIDEAGKPQEVSGSGEMGHEGVKTCLETALSSATFPAPEGGSVRVTYPLVFSGEGGNGDAPPAGSGSSGSSGKLPQEAIQRVVRSNFGSLRVCYEAGLAKDPELAGRVSVKFVIEQDGTVSDAVGSGDMPDEKVVSCVVDAVKKLKFPQPEGGFVTVHYPFVFSPDAKK